MQPTKIRLENIRFGYEHLFEKSSAVDTAEPKYSVEVRVPKDNKKACDQLWDAIEAHKQEAMKSNKGKLPKDFKVWVKDGDDEDADAQYAGHWYFSAKSSNPVGIFSTQKGTDGKPKQLAREEFKGGDYGHVSVSVFTFSKGGNGISFFLNGLMKTRDGEAIGMDASSDFADLADEAADDDVEL